MIRSLTFLALLVAPAAAQTVRLEFELFPGPDGQLGTPDDVPISAPTLFASQPMQLTDEFATLGIRFVPNPSTDNKNEILDAATFATTPDHTPPNILASSGALTITAEFTVPVSRVGALIGISGGADELEIFDAGGASLGVIIGDDQIVSLASPVPIARFEIRPASSTTPAIDNLEFDTMGGAIGTNYCTAVPNSTGVPAVMSATGSNVVANDDLVLVASQLPLQAFGYFLTSQTQGFTANPGGSQGNLCLGGGIGRYVGPGLIQNSGTTGVISIPTDLSNHPTPSGPVQVASGETWNFTAWYRDLSGGVPTSNFADGYSIVFQ